MKVFKHILKVSATILLAFVLVLPIVVKTLHSLENNEHKPCEDLCVHFHEDTISCSICDFHFSTFNYDFKPLFIALETVVTITTEPHYTVLLLNTQKHTQAQLRAPPHYLA